MQAEGEAEPTSPSEPPPSADIGRVIAGRYRINRLVGEGGMAVVYEGEHTEIGKRVAIKIVHAIYSGDDEIVQRFKGEARSASAVESEHIIQVFDAGRDPDIGFYMVMELLKGEDLARILGRERRIDPVFACGLVWQAAHALEKAHAAGIVHRDLKPANIFLTQRDDGSSQVKLVDFGIAKMLRDARERHQNRPGITRRGMAIGTPQYMSPEQAQGLETVDHQTDVYSLGVVLWEAIAGRNLVPDRPTYEQTILALLSEPAPRLSTVVADVPPALDDLLAQMLDHDVTKRTRDMRAVRHALEAIYPEIRGASLRLKSMRPPLASVANVARLGGPATNPAVAYSTKRADRRKRTLRLAILGAVVVGVGVAAIMLLMPATPVAPSSAARGGASTTPTAVTTTTTTATITATATATVTASASASASASAKIPRAPTGTASAPAPDNSARQVGGAGISSQF